jgi:hypothetical protein
MISNTTNKDQPNNYASLSNTSYIKEAKFSINKLIKTLEYEYEIEVDGTPGNWPVVAIPKSGNFIADSRSREIDARIIFCPNTGICNENNPDVLPYNLDYSCGFKNKDLLFTNLRLKVNEKGSSDFSYSPIQHIECSDCLTSSVASFSGNTNLNESTKNTTKITTNLSNLLPGQHYFWSFGKQASNWPVTVYPSSGSFISPDTSYSIDTIITFCKDTSGCSGSPGYLSHTQDHLSDLHKYINLNFTINNSEHCYFDDADYNLNIYCDDCILPTTITNFDNTINDDEIIMLSGAISELVPNRSYSYIFESLGGNYPLIVQNISGSFIAENTDESIVTNAKFCCPSGSCSGTIFPKTHSSFVDNILFQNVKLTLTDNLSNTSKYKSTKVEQKKLDPFFVVPSNITLSEESRGCTKLNVSLNDCLKDHTYYYSYKIKDSNWPVYLDNISGVISNVSGTIDIGSNLTFCASSGLCSGLSGVFDSTKSEARKIDNYCFNQKYVSLYLEVIPNCYPNDMVFSSDTIIVYCENCLGSPSITAVKQD